MNLPIIRMEVQQMKYTVQAMLAEHAAQMDQNIRQAVEAYCTPENLDRVIREAANSAMQAAISDEVKSFFGYTGDGRKVIRAAVLQRLDEMYPPTD